MIYLDNHATTQTDQRVLATMLPMFDCDYANPSNSHNPLSRHVAGIIETARSEIKAFLNSGKDDTLIFTSGATESNNLAIFAALSQTKALSPLVITNVAEHSSVNLPCERLTQQYGYRLETVGLDDNGAVDTKQIIALIHLHQNNVALVCLQTANSEIGSIHDIAAVGRTCEIYEIPFHVDASQSAGWTVPNTQSYRCTSLSISAHKMYGPKGIGALWLKKRPNLKPASIIYGGQQEFGFRPGTLNTPGIVGMAKSCLLAQQECDADTIRVCDLRNRLLEMTKDLPGFKLLGRMSQRLPNNLAFTLTEHHSPVPLATLLGDNGLAAGSTTACISCHKSTNLSIISHLHLTQAQVFHTVRLGLGRFTADYDIEKASCIIKNTAFNRACSTQL